MKLLVIGAGMMGSAAAFDMARSPGVASVTLADSDLKRARRAAERMTKLARQAGPLGRSREHGIAPITAVKLDASNERRARNLMGEHHAALSCVPYFFNLGLTRAAIAAGCHLADLGGNNTVVRRQFKLSAKAKKKGVSLAPDCGLSPGLASILAGELMRRLPPPAPRTGLRRLLPRPFLAGALKIYVGGLPQDPQPPFYYRLVFSVEGLINEYVEPALILRKGKPTHIEPLTEAEEFLQPGCGPLVAFHTSGGTSTLPETFAGRVGECFEKTLRHPAHFQMIRSLYDLGMFSSEPRKLAGARVTPRQMTSALFEEKFAGDAPDMVVLRVEAHRPGLVLSFSLLDRFDPATGMTAMMRTTAWPASIVTQMLAARQAPAGGIHQETDVPAAAFLRALAARGLRPAYSKKETKDARRPAAAS
jgi:lysine 6-dehydrogenase